MLFTINERYLYISQIRRIFSIKASTVTIRTHAFLAVYRLKRKKYILINSSEIGWARRDLCTCLERFRICIEWTLIQKWTVIYVYYQLLLRCYWLLALCFYIVCTSCTKLSPTICIRVCCALFSCDYVISGLHWHWGNGSSHEGYGKNRLVHNKKTQHSTCTSPIITNHMNSSGGNHITTTTQMTREMVCLVYGAKRIYSFSYIISMIIIGYAKISVSIGLHTFVEDLFCI